MRPAIADTDKGQQWLSQFDLRDQALALELIGFLQLVGRDEFEQDIQLRLNRMYENQEGPVALFACREMEEGQHYFSSRDSVQAVPGDRGIGSEGDLAHLIRDISRLNGQFLDHPSVSKMQSSKVRAICAIDDFIGSGTRARRFAEAVHRNPSVKSWISLHWTTFHCLAHSGTLEGIRHVQHGKVHWSTVVANHYPSIPTRTTHDRTMEFQNLCRRYADKVGIPSKWALGYKESFTNVIFPHKCPNTAPAILWYGRSASWVPLFNHRGSFDYPIWPVSLSERERLRITLLEVGQPTLAQLEWISSLGESSVQRLLLLALIAGGFRQPVRIAERMEISAARLDDLLLKVQQLGWITSGRRLTIEGRAILQKAKQLGVQPRERRWGEDPDAFYFMHT